MLTTYLVWCLILQWSVANTATNAAPLWTIGHCRRVLGDTFQDARTRGEGRVCSLKPERIRRPQTLKHRRVERREVAATSRRCSGHWYLVQKRCGVATDVWAVIPAPGC